MTMGVESPWKSKVNLCTVDFGVEIVREHINTVRVEVAFGSGKSTQGLEQKVDEGVTKTV